MSQNINISKDITPTTGINDLSTHHPANEKNLAPLDNEALKDKMAHELAIHVASQMNTIPEQLNDGSVNSGYTSLSGEVFQFNTKDLAKYIKEHHFENIDALIEERKNYLDGKPTSNKFPGINEPYEIGVFLTSNLDKFFAAVEEKSSGKKLDNKNYTTAWEANNVNLDLRFQTEQTINNLIDKNDNLKTKSLNAAKETFQIGGGS